MAWACAWNQAIKGPRRGTDPRAGGVGGTGGCNTAGDRGVVRTTVHAAVMNGPIPLSTVNARGKSHIWPCSKPPFDVCTAGAACVVLDKGLPLVKIHLGLVHLPETGAHTFVDLAQEFLTN